MMDACHEMKEGRVGCIKGSYDSLGMHRMDLDCDVGEYRKFVG